jgi:hypothetical protein
MNTYRCGAYRGPICDIAAESDEKAMQLYIENGDWRLADRTNFVTVITQEMIGGKLSGKRSTHFVMVEPPEPDCIQFFDHEWLPMGGADVCLHCGCRRTITWTRDMRRSVEYMNA